jgi:hypothetical protein
MPSRTICGSRFLPAWCQRCSGAAWVFYLPDNGCIRHCLAIHEQPYRIAVDMMDNASASRPHAHSDSNRRSERFIIGLKTPTRLHDEAKANRRFAARLNAVGDVHSL